MYVCMHIYICQYIVYICIYVYICMHIIVQTNKQQNQSMPLTNKQLLGFAILHMVHRKRKRFTPAPIPVRQLVWNLIHIWYPRNAK